MIGMVKRMKRAGLLGINARNASYQMLLNDRRRYPLVDDKVKTKRLAEEAGLAVPELYAVVAAHWQVKRFEQLLQGRERFVIKPSQGSQGNGIMVIDSRMHYGWRKADGTMITDDDLHYHLVNILSGMYSLAGQPDEAMVEYRVDFDSVFDQVTYQGVPDLRVIVYRGVPCMAMLRLPTRASDGKANLHKGGVGVGVDLATGVTCGGMLYDRPITLHPDTGHTLEGLQVPGWQNILRLSARCADLTGFGYLGVDVVLDRKRGPLILELNARPGLAIQIANRTGLCVPFARIDDMQPNSSSLEDRLQMARQLQPDAALAGASA
ncbi:alpha-L-glutamate ligase-like protein [Fodinicurvata halophila]|uniref:Alpha-L-glutamate ligase-like protein n=1 Tax=Fodinicurvata halophila TaxID=1419723 RepID=A0ABV8UH03_9PROT